MIRKVSREGQDVAVANEVLVNNSQVIEVDEELSKETGLLHSEMRKTEKDFGLADAYVLATARKLKSKLLTGDKHYRNVKEAIMLK